MEPKYMTAFSLWGQKSWVTFILWLAASEGTALAGKDEKFYLLTAWLPRNELAPGFLDIVDLCSFHLFIDFFLRGNGNNIK